jgi:hypothetical protein
MCPKWFVGNDVREILLSCSALTEIVGTDIYPIIAPEGTNGTFILYQRDKLKKTYSKMGLFEEECHLILTIVADDYDIAIATANLVDMALTGEHINEYGCKLTMELYDSTEGFDDNKYYETLIFSIK